MQPGEAPILESGAPVQATQPAMTVEKTDDELWNHGDEYSADPNLASSPTVPDPNNPTGQSGETQNTASEGTLNTETGMVEQPSVVAPATQPEVTQPQSDIETRLARAEQMAKFYENAYNEAFIAQQQQHAAPVQPPQQQGVAPVAPVGPEQLPAGVKGPGEWENADDMVPYVNHKIQQGAAQVANQIMERTYNQNIVPMMTRVNEVLGALEELSVRSAYKDFDEVVGGVVDDLFVRDPSGKLLSVKNPALLTFIKNSPVPKKALYEYALSKQAPQKIQGAVRTATQQVLDQITSKPKGPQMPKTSGGATALTDLDWDSSPEAVDANLKKRGII